MRTYSPVPLILVALAIGLVAGCSNIQSAHHNYVMRGQVVEITGNDAVICVGSADGARVNQEFIAYGLSKREVNVLDEDPVLWERVPVGAVRIERVIDEHFATARVISGAVSVHDVIELSR